MLCGSQRKLITTERHPPQTPEGVQAGRHQATSRECGRGDQVYRRSVSRAAYRQLVLRVTAPHAGGVRAWLDRVVFGADRDLVRDGVGTEKRFHPLAPRPQVDSLANSV